MSVVEQARAVRNQRQQQEAEAASEMRRELIQAVLRVKTGKASEYDVQIIAEISDELGISDAIIANLEQQADKLPKLWKRLSEARELAARWQESRENFRAVEKRCHEEIRQAKRQAGRCHDAHDQCGKLSDRIRRIGVDWPELLDGDWTGEQLQRIQRHDLETLKPRPEFRKPLPKPAAIAEVEDAPEPEPEKKPAPKAKSGSPSAGDLPGVTG